MKKLIEKYLDYALISDLILCILLSVILLQCKIYIKEYIHIPSEDSIDLIGSSLITVGATLVGFLLTVITILVTFKQGFEDKKTDEVCRYREDKKSETEDIKESETIIFDKVVTKESQFYDSVLHKKVAEVFINSTYETALSIFILLCIQFDVVVPNNTVVILLTFLSFLIIVLATIRSLYIFKLFLNVHLHGNNK